MSFFNWGEKTEIRNDARAQVRAELADREENVTEREINQRKAQIDLDIRNYKREQEVNLNNELIARGSELEKADFKMEQARFAPNPSGNPEDERNILVDRTDWIGQNDDFVRAFKYVKSGRGKYFNT